MIFFLQQLIADELPPFPLKNALDGGGGRTVDRFSAEFVDIERILVGVAPLAKTMMEFFNHPGGGYTVFMGKEDKNGTKPKEVRTGILVDG